MPENENNQPPEKKKKSFLWIIIIALIVILAAVIGGFALSYMPLPAWLSGVLPTHHVSEPAYTSLVEAPPTPPTAIAASPTPSAAPAPSPEASLEADEAKMPAITETPSPAVTATPYIGADAAADAALKHSKAPAKEADFSSVILVEQNGMMLYLVEFSAGDYSYEYYVDGITARIESWRKTSNAPAEAKDAIAASAEVSSTVESPEPTAKPEPSAAVLIGEEEVKKLVMDHANIQETEVLSSKCKLELEGLNLIYDVEIKTKLQKYDYEIDALTGEIVGFEIEKNK